MTAKAARRSPSLKDEWAIDMYTQPQQLLKAPQAVNTMPRQRVDPATGEIRYSIGIDKVDSPASKAAVLQHIHTPDPSYTGVDSPKGPIADSRRDS